MGKGRKRRPRHGGGASSSGEVRNGERTGPPQVAQDGGATKQMNETAVTANPGGQSTKCPPDDGGHRPSVRTTSLTDAIFGPPVAAAATKGGDGHVLGGSSSISSRLFSNPAVASETNFLRRGGYDMDNPRIAKRHRPTNRPGPSTEPTAEGKKNVSSDEKGLRVAPRTSRTDVRDAPRPERPSRVRPEAREQILRRRRLQSEDPLLASSLDFPGVFEREDGQNNSVALGGGCGLPPDERTSEMAQAVREHGFCVIRDVLDPSILQGGVLPTARRLQEQVCDALDGRGIAWRCNAGGGNAGGGNGSPANRQMAIAEPQTFRFQEAASRCRGRMDVVLVYGTHNDGASKEGVDGAHAFGTRYIADSLFQNPTFYPVIQNLLGAGRPGAGDDEASVQLVYAGLIFNLPGSDDQPWHQDGVPLFPEAGNAADIQASLPPYALNVFLPLETSDGSPERGPTEFWPGSHRWSAEQLNEANGHCGIDTAAGSHDSDMDDSDDVGGGITGKAASSKTVVGPILKQGDALIYDYRTCHRGTSNLAVGQSKVRRILYLMYARPWFKDHVNFDYTQSAESLLGPVTRK